MGDAIRAAEARLRVRAARVRAQHSAQWRFRSYVLPLGLVGAGLLISIEMGPMRTGAPIPVAPLITAAVLARVYGGVTAARLAVAVALPIVAYIGIAIGAVWYWAEGAALIGLCIERGCSIRYDLGSPRRASVPPSHTPVANLVRTP